MLQSTQELQGGLSGECMKHVTVALFICIYTYFWRKSYLEDRDDLSITFKKLASVPFKLTIMTFLLLCLIHLVYYVIILLIIYPSSSFALRAIGDFNEYTIKYILFIIPVVLLSNSLAWLLISIYSSFETKTKDPASKRRFMLEISYGTIIITFMTSMLMYHTKLTAF